MATDDIDTDSYVTNAAWQRTTARTDAIDDIADQFERPDDATAAFWTEGDPLWPLAPRGWDASTGRDGLGIAS